MTDRLSEDDLVPGQSTSRLLCSICSDLFQDPVFVPSKCQCVFCRACIMESLKAREHCPLCQSSLVGEALQSHRFVRDSIEDLQVVCPGRCHWTGSYSSRKSHLETCPMIRVKKDLAMVQQRLKANLSDQLELQEEQRDLEENMRRLVEEQQRLEQGQPRTQEVVVKTEDQGDSVVLSVRKEFGRAALMEKVEEQEKVIDDVRFELDSREKEIAVLLVRLQAEEQEKESWKQASMEANQLRVQERLNMKEAARQHAEDKLALEKQIKEIKTKESNAKRYVEEQAKVAAKSEAKRPRMAEVKAQAPVVRQSRCRNRMTPDRFEEDEVLPPPPGDPEQVERTKNSEALRLAAKNEDFNQIQLLLEQGLCNVNSQENMNSTTWWTGFTALHWAARYGSVEIASALVKARAHPNIALDDGTTPLHMAAKMGQEEVFKLLVVKAKADLAAKLEDGSTALHIVAKSGYDDLVKFVLTKAQGRGIITVKNHQGKTAMEVAKKKGTRALIEAAMTPSSSSKARSSKG